MAFKMKGSAFKLGNVATKSALKQKIVNQVGSDGVHEYGNPNAESAELDVSKRTRGRLKKYNADGTANRKGGNPQGGAITTNEEQWYKDNPYKSPSAEEQDIFVGKDIEATNDQYTKGKDGKLYITSQETGNSGTRKEDMGGTHFNDKFHVNYGKRLERERDMNSALDMKSPFEQNYDNIAKIDHKEGTEENIKAHKENEKKTYNSDLDIDEMNAELAKTRHLASDKKEEVTLPDPKKKYPKNKKEPKEKKKTYKKRRTKLPKKKKTRNLVTGGYNITKSFKNWNK